MARGTVFFGRCPGPYLWDAMAYLLPFRFSAYSWLGAALLAGCCANNVCDCPGEAKADIIKLVFAPSFSPADLDTVMILRYPLKITAATKPETVTYVRTAAQAYDTLFLNNSAPFSQSGSQKLNQYRYLVKYYATPRRRRPATALIVDSVALQGSFDGTGCCTCYTNSKKTVVVRKDSASAKTTADLKPRPVLLIAK